MTKRSTPIHKFSKLLVCDECGSYLSYFENKSYSGYICKSRYERAQNGVKCTQKRHIDSHDVQDFLDVRLRLVLAGEDFLNQNHGHSINSMILENLANIRATFSEITNQAAGLEKPLTDVVFRAKVDFLSKQISQIKTRLSNLEQQIASTLNNPDREIALREINAMNFDDFWLMPDFEINRVLHGIFGEMRIVTGEGSVVGLGLVKP